MVELVDDGGGAAQRLVAEVDRVDALQSAQPVVVDDLQNVGALHPVHRLDLLVVVDQDDLLFLGGQEGPLGKLADVAAVLVQHREVAVALLGHDLLDVVGVVVQREGEDVVAGHEEVDGHALVDQPRHGVGVVGAGQDDAALVFGALDDGLVGLGAGAQDDAGDTGLDGEKLRLKAVAGDDHVVLGHIVHHPLRGVGRDGDPPLVEGAADVPADDLGFQRLDDVFIRGFGLGDDAVVIDVHVRGGDVGHGDEALQVALLVGDAQGAGLVLLHQAVGLLDGDFSLDRRGLLNLHIRDAGADVRQVLRFLRPKIGEGKGGLFIDLPGALGHIALAGQFSFQFRVGDGRADRVGVGALVPDDGDFF